MSLNQHSTQTDTASLIAEKWTESFTIRSYEVGTQGRLTVQSLCRLLQESAGNHAARLRVAAEDLAEQDLMWVLSKLRLQLYRLPNWHETMRIETWPTTRSAGIRAHRDFRLLVGDELLGLASSMWLLLNRKSRRPTKIPEFLTTLRMDGLPEDLLANFNTPSVHEAEWQKEFEVRASDLDYNQHVNNVCYLSWALDTLPLEFSESYLLRDLQISFLNEARFGEVIISRAGKLPLVASLANEDTDGRNSVIPDTNAFASRTTFAHQILSKNSQKALANVRLTFELMCRH